MSNRDLRSAILLARGCGTFTRLYPGSSPACIRRGVIRTGPAALRRLGVTRLTVLELPRGAYRGVGCWHSTIDWLMQAEIAYQLHYPIVRPVVCDKDGRGGCSLDAFRRVCAARAAAAEWDTGRNSRLSVGAIAARTGLSEATVQRATRLMRVLGLATEVFRGRQRTFRERMASWRVGDKGRGWASVYALHPPNNPQVRAEKFRIDPLPNTSVTPHLRRGPFRDQSCDSSNLLTATGKAGELKSRASRDSATTRAGHRKRKWSPPDPKGLMLARKWRQDRSSPQWAHRHSLEAWSRVLAPVADHDWTPDDLNQLVREHPGLPWVAPDPRKPLALMGALIKGHAATDDLAYRPAYHDMQRENAMRAAAAERRTQIAACTRCGDDGFALGADGITIEPVIRCDHSLPTAVALSEDDPYGH